MKPLESRETGARDYTGYVSTPLAAVGARLARWGLSARVKGRQYPRIGDCLNAGSLLIAAYRDLSNSGLCKEQDAADALL